MKTLCRYGFAAILIFSCLLRLDAQKSGTAPAGWGKVDVRILLMLHPSMANFDYSNGRFYRSDSLLKDFGEVLEKLRKAQIASADVIERLKRERDKLVKSKMDLLLRRDNVLNDLSQKAASSTYNIRGKKERVGEYEERYRKQLQEIEGKLTENVRQIRMAQEQALAPLYLNSEETAKRLAAIKSEIRSVIAQAAQESGIGIVMDTSFAMRSQKLSESMRQIPAIEENPDVVSASLFHSFANFDIDPFLKSYLKGPDGQPLPEEHFVVGRSAGMANNLKSYLQFRQYMPERIADFSSGSIFLIGGTDLTPWAAKKLFARYRVPETIQNSFMILIRNYLDFEKSEVDKIFKPYQ